MKRLVIAALALFGLVVAVAPVTAQPYPNRTVTIIVPYPAGGASRPACAPSRNCTVNKAEAEFHR